MQGNPVALSHDDLKAALLRHCEPRTLQLTPPAGSPGESPLRLQVPAGGRCMPVPPRRAPARPETYLRRPARPDPDLRLIRCPHAGPPGRRSSKSIRPPPPTHIYPRSARAGQPCWPPGPPSRRRILPVRLGDAQQGRHQLPAAAAQGGRSRAGSVTGWPAAAPGRVRVGRPAASTSLAFIFHRSSFHRCRGPGSGPAASIRHRHRQPGRGSASVMGTSDRDDRSGAHKLLR